MGKAFWDWLGPIAIILLICLCFYAGVRRYQDCMKHYNSVWMCLGGR